MMSWQQLPLPAAEPSSSGVGRPTRGRTKDRQGGRACLMMSWQQLTIAAAEPRCPCRDVSFGTEDRVCWPY